MSRFLRRQLTLLLSVVIVLSLCVPASADGGRVYLLSVTVDGTPASKTVQAFDNDFDANTCISLSGLSAVLNGTGKQFSFTMKPAATASDTDNFEIQTGKAGSDSLVTAALTSVTAGESFKNRLFVDGKEKKYGTHRAGKDLFMNLTDVCLMLDLNIEFGYGGELIIDTSGPFSPDFSALCKEGYFSTLNAILAGDADSGRTIWSLNRTRSVPIASLTKLMTYLLAAEAMERGEISADDMVVVTPEAARMSQTPSTMTIWLEEGLEVPISEVIEAMLIASSNESALMLAQHISGSEAEFVALMNARAKELGLRTTKFYTANGLPSYEKKGVNFKRQNTSSAGDLFRLTSYILKHYPQITDITSTILVKLPTMETSWYNSNSLLFNMEGITGLKTGYTNKSGYCLITVLPVDVKGETHDLVTVVLGAETASERNRASEILLMYARSVLEGR